MDSLFTPPVNAAPKIRIEYSAEKNDDLEEAMIGMPVVEMDKEDLVTIKSKTRNFGFRKQRALSESKIGVERERSSRKSLEKIRLHGNLFSADPEMGNWNDDESIERREFIVAMTASLLKFGAATHLVESLMTSVSEALHIPAQINCFPTLIFVTFMSHDRDPSKIQSRTLSLSCSLDLGKLDLCDCLATRVASKTCDFEEAKIELNDILSQGDYYHWGVQLVCFSVVSMSATTLFYGGGLTDGVVAAVIGLLVGLANMLAGKVEAFGRVLEFSCAFMSAFIARVIHAYILPKSTCYFSTALGPMIYLLPGLGTTTGVTEIASGSIMSGGARMFSAFSTYLQLGFGLVVGSRVAVWEGVIQDKDWCTHVLPMEQQVLFFFALVSSLAVLLGIQPSVHVLAAFAAAGVGFSVSAFLDQQGHIAPDTLSFLAAFSVGACGCIHARLAQRPPISIVVLGILLLVPGGIGVRGVEAFFSDDSVSGVTMGTQMFGCALSITLGLLVAKIAVMPVNLKAKRYYQPSLL